MLTRRQTLRGAGALALATVAWPGLTFAQAGSRVASNKRLLVVILRGALDGLAAVPPHGDPQYRAVRRGLALPRPGEAGGALDLDGTFGLHPALAALHEFYRRGDLLVLHAAATAYRGRSHFEGQDVLETGAPGIYAAEDGWLNRALAFLPDPSTGEQSLGLGVGQAVPLILRGPNPVASWAPSNLPEPDGTTVDRLMALYQDDPILGPALAQALAIDDMAETAMLGMDDGGRPNPARQFVTTARMAARLLRAHDGPRIAVADFGGWDTHANQGSQNGYLANRLDSLGSGVQVVAEELGPLWRDTAVLIITEFGRTAAPNGTNGTDHGTATVALLAGGAVNGGRVIADWPGLRKAALFEGRDIQPTVDLRSLFAAILRDHLGIAEGPLEQIVFPESRNLPPLTGLFRLTG